MEHPQGVGIVGIVGTVGIVGIVGITFFHPEPRPTTPSVLVDISCYAYLKEHKLKYQHSASLLSKIRFLCLFFKWYYNFFVNRSESLKKKSYKLSLSKVLIYSIAFFDQTFTSKLFFPSPWLLC